MTHDPSRSSTPEFDAFAADYNEIHRDNVKISGEAPIYFAQYKRRCLERLVGPGFDQPVLDYGCGIGQLTDQLVQRFAQVDGFDPSTASIAKARERLPDTRFVTDTEQIANDRYGLAVVSGVLHHIPPTSRLSAAKAVLAKLTPGEGRVVVFEHNRLNPLTNWVVSQCAFDDDALLLWPWELRSLLRAAGFTRVELHYIVFFPRILAALRPLERRLSFLPAGAQMMATGIRP